MTTLNETIAGLKKQVAELEASAGLPLTSPQADALRRRYGIELSAGKAPNNADMDAKLAAAGITDPVERIKIKRQAERLTAGLEA